MKNELKTIEQIDLSSDTYNDTYNDKELYIPFPIMSAIASNKKKSNQNKIKKCICFDIDTPLNLIKKQCIDNGSRHTLFLQTCKTHDSECKLHDSECLSSFTFGLPNVRLMLSGKHNNSLTLQSYSSYKTKKENEEKYESILGSDVEAYYEWNKLKSDFYHDSFSYDVVPDNFYNSYTMLFLSNICEIIHTKWGGIIRNDQKESLIIIDYKYMHDLNNNCKDEYKILNELILDMEDSIGKPLKLPKNLLNIENLCSYYNKNNEKLNKEDIDEIDKFICGKVDRLDNIMGQNTFDYLDI